MTLELKMNTKIRKGVLLIRDGEVNPIVDLDGIRYLLDVDTFIEYGGLIWTRFSLDTLEPIDEVSFTRHYASHNIFAELLLGSNRQTLPLQVDTLPSFPVPDENGSVIP